MTTSLASSGFRTKQIYVSLKTARRLRWLREVEKSAGRIVTTDEIAERLLNEKIEADYPSIVSMEKRMNVLEDQMVMELGKEREPEAAA